ncbi:MAG: addiction module protein [Desulfobacterales bacterium]|nr:addiction module protein [Desulfobacterales bacterium]
MESTLQIDKMTVSDKLKTMELIWDDLCRTSEQIPSPGWHEKILRTREERITQGTAQFSDWMEAKEKIRTSVK